MTKQGRKFDLMQYKTDFDHNLERHLYATRHSCHHFSTLESIFTYYYIFKMKSMDELRRDKISS